MSEETKVARTLIGQVVSDGMDKTIAVQVERRVKHPLYRKYVRRSTKILAHPTDPAKARRVSASRGAPTTRHGQPRASRWGATSRSANSSNDRP